MAYSKKTWKGRLGEGLNKYVIGAEDTNGKQTITSAPDEITQEGDALSASNLNDLETRISNEFTNVNTEIDDIKGGTTVVKEAEKATKDANGNTITTTYATKEENSAKADADADAVNGNMAMFDSNGNPVDAGVPASNVAQKDGYNGRMTVGSAEQLLSNVSKEDKVPYNFRTAGGAVEIGDREDLVYIGGGSINWGQRAQVAVATGVQGKWRAFNYASTLTADASTRTISVKDAGTSNVSRDAICTVHASPIKCAFVSAKLKNNYTDREITYAIECVYDTVGSGQFSAGTIPAGQTIVKEAVIYAPSTSKFNYIGFIFNDNSGIGVESEIAIDIIDPQIFDLTAMFGSTIADYIQTLETGNAGAGVGFFRKLFPKPYYAYNAGSLESVCVSAHNMTGFNQWDEEVEVNESQLWSKNYIPAIPNTVYYAETPSAITVRFYDVNKTQISYQSSIIRSTFTTPSGCCYMRFSVASGYGTTYNHDICINLHYDGERDGEYEPYKQESYALDSNLTLRGIPKLDGNNKLYFDGDEYYSDGTVNRRYGIVDLGTLYYSHRESSGRHIFETTISGIKKTSSGSVVLPCLCSLYTPVTYNATWVNGDVSWGSLNSELISFVNNNYSDAAQFKTAMSGVYLNYELATPTTESATPYTNPQIVDNWGTEEYVDYPESQGLRDVAIPVGHNTKYPINLRAKAEVAPDSPDGDGDYIMRQTNGMNEYVLLEKELPSTTSLEDGNYRLKVSIASGVPTFSWEVEE